MKNAIFQYELKNWLKSSLFYLLALSFFLFSLVTMLGTGGYFDEPNNSVSYVQLLNSPYSLCSISFLFAKFLLFVVAVFGGFSLYRDYKNNTHAILYSFPISKSFYLNGKLGSVIFVIFIVSVLTFLGIGTGEIMLGADNPKIEANSLLGYIVALGLYLIPTLIIIGVIVFVSVGISRNIFSGFIVVICFVLFQLILENIFFNQKELLALLDPFGQNAFHLATQNWDVETQNSTRLPANLIVIWNRVFWLFVAFSIYGIFFRKFNFQYDSIWQLKKKNPRTQAVATPPTKKLDLESNIHYDFSNTAKIKYLIRLMSYDFKSIVKNWMFLVLCLFGGAAVFFIQLKVSNTGEFNLFPLTKLFIGAPLGIYTLVIIFSTFLFSGLSINKARQYKMNLMVDATPILNWQLIFSKIGAISLIQIVQLLLFILIGIFIQVINRYYNFEFDVYLFHLFVLVFPVLFVWNITSQFIHTLIPNLFLSLFILAVIWFGSQSLEQIGIKTHLLKYNTLPSLDYSDFNGYGSQLKGYLLLMMYWLVFGFLLLATIPVIWNRGSLSSMKERFKLAKFRFNKSLLFLLALSLVILLSLASKIYKLETIDKNSFAATNSGLILKNYKKEWKPFIHLIQPKITDIHVRLNLYLHEGNFDATGIYKLVNQSDEIIDTVFIRTGFDEITELDWKGKAQLLKENIDMKSYLYKLTHPLFPRDSVNFSFTIKNTPNTIFSQNSNVLKNGSYLQQDILPRLGYQFIEHELLLTDSLVNSNNYFHRDASYVNIHTVISTAKDQIALAPGAFISERKEAKRNIYEYQASQPVKFNFSFHSATFEVIEEKYKNVDIQLYCKKGHEANTKLMLDGLKAALDYNSRLFGSYPYKSLRIIEFPNTEKSYSATLISNNIPTSEVLFNINAAVMGENINLPFYVMAHELTHEWFGNQVIPADAEGAKMLTESITEYIALCIYEAYFGTTSAEKFLNAQYNRYYQGRKREQGKEQPLNKVLSHQEYIAYGKGAIAFHTISKAIGRKQFDSILQEYLSKYKYRSNYYPTTQDFIQLLKANTDEKHHPLIDHWLAQINEV